MNQSLFLEYDRGTIAVIRNPYERLISLYRDDWDYIGFDNWVAKNDLQSQAALYEKCEVIITLENWEQDLISLSIDEPKNSSILMEQTISDDYRRWFTNKSLMLTARLVRPDLNTYGYTF